jgi:hypothetical protein
MRLRLEKRSAGFPTREFLLLAGKKTRPPLILNSIWRSKVKYPESLDLGERSYLKFLIDRTAKFAKNRTAKTARRQVFIAAGFIFPFVLIREIRGLFLFSLPAFCFGGFIF